ncbi:MAG: CoA transferase [Gammaproteobacteria bacterium]|nr:MAG: CoA transferase [Gammaproteobacteria bacterium]
MQPQSLQGIKVIDLSRVLAGPSSTQILADLGAEVIKIERPNIGDETRYWSPPVFTNDDGSETSAYFATVNRNKSSLTLDISHPEGQAIIKKLIKEADILVENFKVGNLAKYGLDYESVKAINPQLIYASLTGFGQTGVDAHKAGYDYIIQGMSGLMSITGPADGEPHKVGVAVVDLFAGLQLTIGIQSALLARAHTGLGQHVDVALLDSAITMLANVGMNHLATDKVPPRLGNFHPNIVPYQVFNACDGHFILACGNDKQFIKVCEVMEQDWYQDEKFATNPQRVANRDELVPKMEAVFATKTRAEWLAKFEKVSVASGPINNIAEAVAMPQVQQREMVVDFTQSEQTQSAVKTLGNPIKLSATPVQYNTAPPTLGEHTVEVLSELGLSDKEIRELQDKGVI